MPVLLRARTPWRVLGTLLFLAYLLVALGPVPKVVLCIGEDGHLALEADPEADCDCAPGSKMPTSECSTCVDIPLLAGAGSVIAGNLRPAGQSSNPCGGLPSPASCVDPKASPFDQQPMGSLTNHPHSGESTRALPLRL
jgi:hypothetical protein